MPDFVADRQLLMAVLAAHLGFVSEDTACDAIAAANAKHDVSLEGQLDALGKLSSRQIRLLEDLAEERLGNSVQPVWEWCAGHVSKSFLHSLHARGLQSSAERLSSADSKNVKDSEHTGTQAHDKSLLETANEGDTPGSSQADFDVNQPVAALAPSRYRIVRELAQGGLGTVSVAEDLPLEREVAFKEIRPEKADDERSQSRFLIEAQITGRLEHPSIVPVYDVGSRESGGPFYVMRLIHGESMKDVLNKFYQNEERDSATGKKPESSRGDDRRERNIEFRDLLSRFVDVCQAVAYAHQHGVIHRDLKPANIMLGKFGETLLVDWGLAKVLGGDDSSQPDDLTVTHTESTAPNLTVAGMAIGTPSFMSPEQAVGDIGRINAASDIYGLGATLFAIITGRRPVTGSSTAEVIELVRQGRLEIHESAPPAGVPPALWAICRKAMQNRPQDRYASATDLAHDVERYLADEPVSALREPLSSRARRWIRHHSTVVSTASAICLMAIVSLSIGLSVYAGLSNRLETTNGQLEASNTQLEDANTLLTETNQQLQDSIAAEQQARTAAESRLLLAMNSVDTYLSEITDNQELQRPDLRHLRRSLLANAVPFFEQLLQQAPGDSEVEFMRGKSHIRLSSIHAELANASQAETEIERAIEILTSVTQKHPQNYDYLFHLAVAQNNLGTLLMNAGRYAESRAALEATLETRTQLAEGYPDDVTVRRDHARTLTNLGLICAAEAEFEAAIALHEQAIVRRKINLEATSSSAESVLELSNSYQNMGIAMVGANQVDAAHEAFEQAVELHESRLDAIRDKYEWTLGYGSALDSLGNSFYNNRDYAAAQEIRAKLVSLYRELQQAYPQVAQVKRGLGNALVQHAVIISETDPMADFLTPGEEALRIFAEMSNVYGDDFGFRKDVANANYTMGNLLQMRGQTVRAGERFRQAGETLRPLIEGLPEDSHEQLMLRAQLADAISGEASILGYSGDHETAASMYAQAAEERGKVGALSSDKITLLGGQADALHNAAMERYYLQQNDIAREGFEQALAVREELLSTFPDDTYLLSQQATTHNGLAILLGVVQEVDGCRQHYEECLKLCERLIAIEGDYYLHARITAAGAISNLASLELRVGNTAKAVERYDQAVDSLEETLTEQPGEPTASQFLSITLRGRAEMRDHAEQFAAAAADWKRAAEVDNANHYAYYKMYEALSRVKANELEEALLLVRENASLTPDLKFMGAKVRTLAAAATEDETQKELHLSAAVSALLELEQDAFFMQQTFTEDLKSNADWDALRENSNFVELLERLNAG